MMTAPHLFLRRNSGVSWHDTGGQYSVMALWLLWNGHAGRIEFQISQTIQPGLEPLCSRCCTTCLPSLNIYGLMLTDTQAEVRSMKCLHFLIFFFFQILFIYFCSMHEFCLHEHICTMCVHFWNFLTFITAIKAIKTARSWNATEG